MTSTMDGAQLCSMMMNAAACVEQHKQQINELNVFPVPDGDTGTNMSLTLSAAAADLRAAGEGSLGKVAGTAASALLRGARGNSGVITSLLFRGFAKYLKDLDSADGYQFAAALAEGVETAYKAVMKPAEGTILTVSRVCAEQALEEAAQDRSLEHILEFSLSASKAALEQTVNQNPVLKKAGVVDAGGMGFFYILEGMLKSLRGEIIAPADDCAASAGADFAALSLDEITYTYDTVFIVRKDTPEVDLTPLRAYLSSIGDSLVIGESDEAFKVHVHTDLPGEALTHSQQYGTLELAKIENMRTQAEALAAGRHVQSTDDLEAVEAELKQAEASEPAADFAPPEKKYGIVTVCSGAGIRSVFADLGVDGFVEGGQTMNPSTEDILKQINRTPAETVLVLPNNKNIIMASEQAKKIADREIVVLPTRTIPQGITAMLNFDESLSGEDNAIAMMQAADRVATGLVTFAARNSDYEGHKIKQGEILALENGKLSFTDKDVAHAASKLTRSLLKKDSSFVTVISGCDVPEEDAQRLTAQLRDKVPGSVEVTHLVGGQPVYYYIISVE